MWMAPPWLAYSHEHIAGIFKKFTSFKHLLFGEGVGGASAFNMIGISH